MLQDPSYGSGNVPDNLVYLRQFVGGLDAVLNDQSYAGTDSVAYNPSGRFVSVGPTSVSQEGQPFTLATTGGGVQLSGPMVLLVIGLVAFVLHKKG